MRSSRYVEGQRMSVVRDFCGHGLGRVFHAPPNVLHYGRPGTGPVLEEGMFFTIEPMVNLGRPETKVLADDWTAVTRDKSLSAQFEHSIGVTATGARSSRCRPRASSTRPGADPIRALVALLAALAIAVSVWQLQAGRAGLVIEPLSVGTIPATVHRLPDAAGPVVVIAHGFAGSRQLMEPFALTLARAGYIAVSFDFQGHGRNPAPMSGDVTSIDGTTRLPDRRDAGRGRRGLALPGADGRLALWAIPWPPTSWCGRRCRTRASARRSPSRCSRARSPPPTRRTCW
jgi:hypothetical protein